MSKIRRICLHAGPGVGKSSISSGLMSDLKKRHFDVEQTQEFIKKYAYQKIPIKHFDQLHIFSTQMNEEYMFLKSVRYIVSDSPLLIQTAYMAREKSIIFDECLSITHKFEAEFPSLNIMLDREGIPYKEHGRYESYEEAIEMDNRIEAMLIKNNFNYVKIKTVDYDKILKYVLENL